MIRERLSDLKATRKSKLKELRGLVTELEEEDKQCRIHDEARIVIQKAAQVAQEKLETHISNIVTKALRIVFLDEAKPFIAKFVRRRNTTECDLHFESNGKLLDPLDSCGFGEADVVSFALKLSYLALGTRRSVLIVDEPFSNLDGERIERASEMMKILSKELGIQMIVITHELALIANCDKRFHVTMFKKKSTVKHIIRSSYGQAEKEKG